jgi:hypothetical protein
MEKQYGPVWYGAKSLERKHQTIGFGDRFMKKETVGLRIWEDEVWLYTDLVSRMASVSRKAEAPSPTLLALLADLPLSGCWPAVVDRIIEEYPETEPYIRPVLEAYDASTSTVSETDTVGAYSSAK